MSHADFVHLRIHSAYSMSEGALKTGEIVELCKAHGMPAVAVTDTNNLFGALEVSQACAKAGIQPIVGCQLDICVTPVKGNGVTAATLEPILLYAQDETGYANLLKLVSRAYLDVEPGAEPHVPLSLVEELGEGLILLTGGPAGPLGRLLLNGQTDAARDLLQRLARAFGDRLYVELSRHGLEDERRIEDQVIALAYDFDLPLVATNEAFFGQAEMFEAHDALMCVAQGTYIYADDRARLTPDHRFKSAAEMRALFADLPEAVDNTLSIARRCAVMVETRPPILPNFETVGDRTESEQLRADAEAGLETRLEEHVYPIVAEGARERVAAEYRDRLATELGIIEQMGFPGYFLIVADFIQWAKGNGIPVGPGRGSGAGSVVAWALTITDLDPLRWGLLFERFLNPERISMPDFDVDFCQERRDEVIAYVQDKYGRDKVAQIITFGKLQARAVLRDVGRVLQMPYGQVDRICKLVPNNPANPVTLAQAIEIEPMLQQMRQDEESVARLIDIALKLEGLYRHASTHAAGVVIGDRPLDELIPLYRDPRSEMPVTQFNMKDVEKAGLVKFDFLGLKTLSVLALAVKHLERRGIALSLEGLPLDDAATYEMMSRGETTGVFQLESAGMRDALRRLKPDRFEDIIAVVALYRPGPMENIPSYINRKHGQEEPDYLHPKLEPILKETYGIIIYQEQVMQIAQILAGYTLGGADVLRRAMGKKIKAEMDSQRAIFVDGAVANGLDKKHASFIFDLVDKFAGYGFNKSHAAAYALVAYQTGYLKANHPVEFLAASMTFDMGNADKLTGFRRELQRLGIALRPPDVNASEAAFAVEDGAIRYALAALKNVGRNAMEALVRERQENGPFRSVADFARRLGSTVINKRQLENLIKAGALDSLSPNRRQLFEAVDAIVRLASAAEGQRDSDQTSLFGDAPDEDSRDLPLPQVPDWPVTDRLRFEFEAVGLYLSAHPLDAYEKSLQRLGIGSYADLAQKVNTGRTPASVKLAGTVIGRKERRSARGNKFAFIQLSDPSGMFEVTAFSEVLANAREMLDEAATSGAPVIVSADVRTEEESIRLLANSVGSLDTAVAQSAAGLRVWVTDEEAVDPLKAVVAKERQGRGRIQVVVPLGPREAHISLAGAYMISPAFRQAIKSIPGIMHVEEV